MVTIKKFFFYTFALFSLTSIIYGIAYDYMNGAEIHYDFFGAGFVSWLIFFGILKAILNIWWIVKYIATNKKDSYWRSRVKCK